MSRLASWLVLACSSFGLVGVLSVNSLAVEVLTSTERSIIGPNGENYPVFELRVRPPFPSGGSVISITQLSEVPVSARSGSSTGFWLRTFGDNRYYYLIYNYDDDIIYKRTSSSDSYTRSILEAFIQSVYYTRFLRDNETIDFLNIEGLTGTISQSVGKMIAVGLLLGIGLLSFKVGITSLDKFLDNKFWYKRFENERSALEKEYNRLSRVYRDDPQGQKNLDRRFARRNTRLYEKYVDYGVEKEDLIRTE